MPVRPYNEVRPRLGERVFVAPLDDEQRELIGEITARYVRLEEGYRRMFAGGEH